MKKPVQHYSGHRERLRQRFRKSGGDALQSYELLELVLFRAIPRRDIKPLAKALLARFGDLSAIFSASVESLREIPGITENMITELKLIEAVALEVGQSRSLHKPLLSSWDHLIEYLRAKTADKSIEEFHVLFLDKKNQIIADEVMGRGTVDHAPVYPREIIKRALQLDASALVLMHNHPSGDPAPSRADIDMTRKIQDLASGFSIRLHDHVIIGRQSEVSFKNMGLIT
jgi:DNA repair protein RadC